VFAADPESRVTGACERLRRRVDRDHLAADHHRPGRIQVQQPRVPAHQFPRMLQVQRAKSPADDRPGKAPKSAFCSGRQSACEPARERHAWMQDPYARR
jgi:hypothetical protein